MKTAYLSLGSNVGDREAHLKRALDRLAREDIRVKRKSSIYETEPQDLRKQAWFLNLAAEIETSLFPRQLLHRIQHIEREMGRKRVIAKGPREIDIDILLYGNFVISTEVLTIPHPRLSERRFVLQPLADLAPDLRHPVSHVSIRELLAGLSGQIVKRTQISL